MIELFMKLLKCYTKRLLLTIFILVVAKIGCGQVIISGQIIDQNAQPVTNVNVLVYLADTKILAAYGITGIDGRFNIKSTAKADSLDVTTSSISFKKVIKRIGNNSSELIFVLEQDVKQLDVFTVRALPIQKRGDTLSYLVSAFTSIKDRTIEDVLKKMPGIEVEKDGKILYQGMPIQKFYVEGLDLMDGRYSVVSSNLPQNSVATVEIYENHQPLKILEDKVYSQQASLNLKLKQDIVTTGTGVIGIGFNPLLWNAKITPMTFTKKFQCLSSYQTNNTGEDVTRQLRTLSKRDITRDLELPDEMSSVVGLYSAPIPDIDERRFLDNCVHLLNFNGLYKPGQDHQLRLNLFYINDIQKYESHFERKIYLAEDTLSFEESIKNRMHRQSLQGVLNYEKNATNGYLQNEFSFRADQNQNQGYFFNTNESVNQENRDPRNSFYNKFLFIHPIRNNLLELTSYFSFDKGMPDLMVYPGSFTQIFNYGQPYETSVQEVDQKRFFADHSAGIIFNKGLFKISSRSGITFVSNSLNTDLKLVVEDRKHSAGTGYQNEQRATRVKIYTITGLEFKKSGFTVNASIPISWQDYTLQDFKRESQRNSSGLYIDPGISVYYKFKGFWTLNGSWSYTNKIGEDERHYSGFILRDFQSIINSNAPVSKYSLSRYKAAVLYQNPLNSMFGSIHYLFTESNNNLLFRNLVDTSGALSLVAVEFPNVQMIHSIQSKFSKFFGSLKTTVGLRFLFTTQNGKVLINDEVNTASNYITDVKPYIDARIFSWLNGEYSLGLMRLNTRIHGGQSSGRNLTTHGLNLYTVFLKNQQLSLTSEYYYIYSQPHYFIDLKYKYSISKKKIEIEAGWYNIFNSTDYISYQLGTYTIYETVFRLRPSQLMVNLYFNF